MILQLRRKVGPLFALAAVLVIGASVPGFAKATKGEPAPDFSGTALDGRKIALSQFRGKNPVVLNFYADFSPQSRAEFPNLKNLDEKYGARGLKVVAVCMDEDRNAASALPKANNVKFPVIFDPKGMIADKYGVQTIPHTLVLDRDGKVHTEIIGSDVDLLNRAVNQVLK